jgi:hypothetical protein
MYHVQHSCDQQLQCKSTWERLSKLYYWVYTFMHWNYWKQNALTLWPRAPCLGKEIHTGSFSSGIYWLTIARITTSCIPFYTDFIELQTSTIIIYNNLATSHNLYISLGQECLLHMSCISNILAEAECINDYMLKVHGTFHYRVQCLLMCHKL